MGLKVQYNEYRQQKDEVVSGLLARKILMLGLVKLRSQYTHVDSQAWHDRPVEYIHIIWIPIYGIIYTKFL